MRRGQLIWGVFLVLLGGLMLAGQMGVRLPNGESLLSLFWPLALILFGAWVLLSVFVRGNVETESASVDLQGASEARIRVNHGAGEFHLHSGANGYELAHGTFVGGLDQKTSRNGSTLDVKMSPASNFIMDFPFFGPRHQLDWNVSLNASVPTALDLSLGANKSVMDLRDMKITNLRLSSGASEAEVTLPAQGRLNADFEIGAASLTLIVPEGVSARIRSTIGAGEVRVDTVRFPQSNGSYISTDFETAANAIDINIRGGACSVRVR